MRRSRLRSAPLATLALAAALAGCGSEDPPTPSHTVRFGVLQSVDQLPLFVMEDRGFAEDHGVKLVVTVMEGGTQLIAEMAAGAIDGAYPGAVPMIEAAREGTVPGEVAAFAAVAFADADHRAFALVTAPGIRRWQDLAGRVIAVNQPLTIGDGAVRARLAQERVRGARIVSIPFPNQGLAVAGGTVDAAAMLEPFITQSLLRGDGRILDWIVGGGAPFPEFEESVLAFSTRFAERRPEAVRAFLRAHLQATRWIAAHEAEARTILVRRLGLTAEVGRRMRLVRFSTDGRHDLDLLGQTEAAIRRIQPGSTQVAVGDLLDGGPLRDVAAGDER